MLWYKQLIIKNYRVPTQHGFMPFHGVSFAFFLIDARLTFLFGINFRPVTLLRKRISD
jgi:hypothetical protein